MGKFYTDRSVKKLAQASRSLSINLKFETMPSHIFVFPIPTNYCKKQPTFPVPAIRSFTLPLSCWLQPFNTLATYVIGCSFKWEEWRESWFTSEQIRMVVFLTRQ